LIWIAIKELFFVMGILKIIVPCGIFNELINYKGGDGVISGSCDNIAVWPYGPFNPFEESRDT